MIVVIHGPAGTGKSTVSGLLQNRLGAERTVVMDIDRCCDIDWHYEDRQKTTAEMIRLYLAKSKDLDFIVNWAFHDFNVLKEFATLLGKINSPVHIFIFTADEKVRQARLEKRSNFKWVFEESQKKANDLKKKEWEHFKNAIDSTSLKPEEIVEKMFPILNAKET